MLRANVRFPPNQSYERVVVANVLSVCSDESLAH